jgi:acetyl-CoA synthetase
MNTKKTNVYYPHTDFANQANLKQINQDLDYQNFWGEMARNLDWFKEWDQVMTGEGPFTKWFETGTINAAYNCIDRHLTTWRKNKAAIIFEGEPGDRRVLTYYDLYREVTKFSNTLKQLGVEKGDIVTIYLPMIPEAIISMLACARIGAPHSVVFGGFSSHALSDRISDSNSKLVITVDGYWRRGRVIPAKTNVDKAIDGCASVENVIVVKRTGHHIFMEKDRDYWYDELMDWAPIGCGPEHMNSEDTLFLLYTSGTTGKPKGIVHSTGGYLTGVSTTHKSVFDIKDDDVYWCTADVGWITGHSYIVYGPLANGSTLLIYEGAPDYPEKDRMWKLVESYGVSIFYTSPTAIRMFMKWGEAWIDKHDLSSLRLLGSVGEPINPEVWEWYHHKIGAGKCPIVDTWWQTETGSIMISPLPGITPTKPGSATKPMPGILADVVDENGKEVANGQSGYLTVKRPWPSMLRDVYKDTQRYLDTYWSFIKNQYFTGDGAYKDEDGYIWVTGRVDDVINISGHRIGSAEVESVLVENMHVAEAAAVGIKDPIKGSAINVFVTLRESVRPSEELIGILQEMVTSNIGRFAKPDRVFFIRDLPKTRSGKIMRRVLRDIAEGSELGDLSTLVDQSVVTDLLNTRKESA